MNTVNFMRICCAAGMIFMNLSACANEPIPLTQPKEVVNMEEHAKRKAPKPVDPVEIGNIRYEVVRGAKSRGFNQNGGIIAAIDTIKSEELWTVVVYQTAYDPNEEKDVQDVHITKLTPSKDKNQLCIENEAHKTYLLNLTTREVTEK